MARLTAILVLIALASCSVRQVPFDKKQWNVRDGHYYLREGMVDDLLENHLHTGMSRDSIVDLLGPGERNWSERDCTYLELTYEIAVDYVFSDIDPVGGIYLHIDFTADSLASDFSINYWGKREGRQKNMTE